MSSAKPAIGGPHLSLAMCFAMCLPGPLSGLAQTTLGPVMPEIARHFSDVPNAGALVRAMVSALSAAMIVGALAAGYLAERFGELRTLMVSLVVFAISGTAGFFIDDLQLMVVSRVILGIANAIAGVVAMAILTTRVAMGARERWMGFFVVGGTLGSVAVVILVGIISAWGWRYAFLPHLFAVPAAIFIALVFPARERTRVEVRTPGASGGFPWAKVLVGILVGAATASPAMYLPFYLESIGGGDPRTVAVSLAAVTFTGGITSLLFGWVRKHVSVMNVFVIGLVVMFGGMIVTVFAAEPLSVHVGMAIFGVGMGMLVPNFFSSAAATAPPELRARVLGQIRGAYYAGPLVAQPFLELAVSRSGTSAAMLGIALMAVVALMIVFIFRRVFTPYESALQPA